MGAFGADGYALAAWNDGGASDLGSGVSVTLLQGGRYQWSDNAGTAVRALQSPGKTTRRAGAWYDSTQLRLRLDFSQAYSGNLHLYAVDWDSTARRETVNVGLDSASLSSDFSQGNWVTTPVNVAAGGSVTITVDSVAGANAVLSGIFLGEGPTGLTTSQSPQGNWVDSFGSDGYALGAWNGEGGSDLTGGASVTLVQGDRYQWTGDATGDPRALQSPGKSTRKAGAWYSPDTLALRLDFTSAYRGNLHLYAVDWDTTARRETINIGGQTVDLSTSFNQGRWVTVPISVPAGGSLTIQVERTAGLNAVVSGIFLGETPTAATVSSSPQGNWVDSFGGDGYALGGWNGGTSDLTNGVSVSLTQGRRWLSSGDATGDVRALQSPSKSTRRAAMWYDDSALRLRLNFTSAYHGNLHLYAVDWGSSGRRETITVGGQIVPLSSDFTSGAWVTVPITVAAGGSLTIAVDRNAGPNAVLSGIFLGERGPPTVTQAPQGNWVDSFGGDGYALASWNDTDSDLTNGADVTLTQGSRFQWTADADGDVRALESPTKSVRRAATWFDPDTLRLRVNFGAAYSGKLHLYALDWSTTARRETISVGGHTVSLNGDFSQGKWVTVPITVAAGDSLTIAVTRTAGENAVLSGIFLGEAPNAPSVSQSPQGNWVDSFGGDGYALGAWNGSSDLSAGVNATLTQGKRFRWTSNAGGDVRALQSPDKSTRRAAAWYDPNTLRLRLDFSSAYRGNLRLYAVDWDTSARRETITVGDRTVLLDGDFSQGAWVTVPIDVPAGDSLTIAVSRTAGANAVLSGIFLGGDATTGITTSPALKPGFDPSINDYVLRCDAAQPVQVQAQGAPGSTTAIDGHQPKAGANSASVSLSPGQAFDVVISDGTTDKTYHVRCLPSDFPSYNFTKTGTPSQQYYILTPSLGAGGKPYVAMFNADGVPVWWYKDAQSTIDAKLLPNGHLLWSHNFGGGFVTGTQNTTVERRLDGSLVRTIRGPNNSPMDGHDTTVLPNGNVLTVAYVERSTTTDLSAFGGPSSAHVLDALIQEQDPAGNQVWSWNSKDHIASSESQRWLPNVSSTYPNGDTVYDLVHINAVTPVPGGLLVSMRHADAVYKIDKTSGDVVWKLGGTTTAKSLTVNGDPQSYPLGGQHDVRILSDNTITIHDNATNLGRQPRAVRYSINESAKTATMVEQQDDPTTVPSSNCCGSARKLDNGGWVIHFGGGGITEEFAANGAKVFNLTFPGLFMYRTVPVPTGVLSPQAVRDGMDAQFPR